MKKINLYLMSFKGYKVLEEVIENNLNLINCVCIGSDQNVMKDYFEEMKKLCEDNKLLFFSSKEAYKIPEAEYSIAISWKRMIRNVDNLIVFHDSLLPKYRGFAPLVSQLINGEEYLGVSAIFANNSYDQGDIIIQKSKKITYPIKIKEAIELATTCYLDCLEFILHRIKKGNALEAKSQDDSKATYSLWRDQEDYIINWNKPSIVVKRFIDSVGFPYKGAKTYLMDREVIIEDVDLFDDVNIENRDLGKVIFIIEGRPVIVCLNGLIILKKAFYADNCESIFPFKNIRSRFKG